MNNNRRKLSWCRVHISAIFVSLILICGFALLFASLWVGTTSPVASLLLTLSGALFASGVAGVFLSFREVQDHLAKIFSSSLANGSMIKILSPPARDSFEEQILLAKLSGNALILEPTLLKHFRNVKQECFKMVHLHNYKIREEISIDSKTNDYLVCSYEISFRAKTFHLVSKKGFLKYKLLDETVLQKVENMDGECSIYGLKGNIGGTILDESNISCKKIKKGKIFVMMAEINFEAQIEEEMDCYFEYKKRRQKDDNIACWFARYPTSGFEYDLHFDKQYEYHGAVFKGEDPKYIDFPGPDNVRTHANGCLIDTHDWILPGEGVYIQWLPKKNEV